MAISVVQSKSGTGHSLTLNSATTAGNCVIVGYGATNTATSTTACTLGGSAGNFTKAAEAYNGSSSLISIWADPNCAGGQTAIAITPSPSGALDTIWAIEVSGLAAASVVDKTSTSTTAQASWTSGTTATTTQAVELWVGALNDGASTPTGPASPWVNTAVSNTIAYLYGYDIVSATGGAVYSGTGGDGSNLSAAVVALKGLSAGTSGTVQPRATVPVPRRKPGRALWRQITGQAFAAVPAPRQQPAPAPRRKPARAVWRAAAGQAFVQVPAPRQQPAPAPRRRPARAVVRFIPVTTTNAVTPPSGTVQSRATLVTARRRLSRALIPARPGPLVPLVPAVTEGGPVYYPYHHRGRGRTR